MIPSRHFFQVKTTTIIWKLKDKAIIEPFYLNEYIRGIGMLFDIAEGFPKNEKRPIKSELEYFLLFFLFKTLIWQKKC